MAGRDSGAALRRTIEGLADEGAVVLVEFEGVDLVTPGFADELFGRLRPDLIAAERVRFVGLNEPISALKELVSRRRHIVPEAPSL